MRKRRAPKEMPDAYRYWILDCLAGQSQGRAPVAMVYAHVYRNLGQYFGAREKADVPSSAELTWKNDVRHKRRDMKTDGLLISGGHGIWEITNAGRTWLKHHPDSGIPEDFREL
jgi:restriction endonuclease Mrr